MRSENVSKAEEGPCMPSFHDTLDTNIIPFLRLPHPISTAFNMDNRARPRVVTTTMRDEADPLGIRIHQDLRTDDCRLRLTHPVPASSSVQPPFHR